MSGYVELIDVSLSVSTLTAPEPPFGFEVDIRYETRETLNPLGVYLSAIDCMYQFAQEGWYKGLAGGLKVWAEGYDVEVLIQALREPHDRLALETIHIVFGLYETLVEVATQSRFCELVATLLLHRRRLGYLYIQKRTPQTLKSGSDARNLTVVKAFLPSNEVTYPSGHFIDPDEPEFSIHYTFSGTRINSKGIFLAVLGALAASAQYSPDRSFVSLRATSPAGDCVINIRETDASFELNYSFITKALRMMITDIIVPLRKFEEITFQLKWEALSMAEAYIKLADRAVVA